MPSGPVTEVSTLTAHALLDSYRDRSVLPVEVIDALACCQSSTNR